MRQQQAHPLVRRRPSVIGQYRELMWTHEACVPTFLRGSTPQNSNQPSGASTTVEDRRRVAYDPGGCAMTKAATVRIGTSDHEVLRQPVQSAAIPVRRSKRRARTKVFNVNGDALPTAPITQSRQPAGGSRFNPATGPVSMPFTEIYEALQRGVVDCAVTSLAVAETAGLIPVAKHLHVPLQRCAGAQLRGRRRSRRQRRGVGRPQGADRRPGRDRAGGRPPPRTR